MFFFIYFFYSFTVGTLSDLETELISKVMAIFILKAFV